MDMTPGMWLSRLITELGTRQERYQLLDRYHRSDAPMPPGPTNRKRQRTQDNFANYDNKFDPFETLRRISRVNWADMIVEALIERMKVLGFTSGSEGNEQEDARAWAYWQANDLDTALPQLLRTKGALSEAYMIVGPVDERINAPRITCEDPRQTITEHDPVDRRRVLAALKVYGDEVAGVDRAYLYLPNPDGPALLYRATRERAADTKAMLYTADRWEFEPAEELPTVDVPVVWFPNRADLFGRTMGEFEHVLDDLNRIAMLVLHRMQITMLQAFRQRAAIGKFPEKDGAGNVIDYDALFSGDPAAFWLLDSGTQMWESSGLDLSPILEAVKADVRELAGRTRTPLYYLYPDSGGYAEGAVTQREGLIFRAAARITETEGPLERVMALTFEAAGETPSADMETVWLRPDLATLSERYDAASKALAAGLPHRTVWREILQYSQQEIERIEAERAAMAASAPVLPAPAAA